MDHEQKFYLKRRRSTHANKKKCKKTLLYHLIIYIAVTHATKPGKQT